MLEKKTNAVRENSRGWMIQVLSARLDKAMEKRLQAVNLNIRQFGIMMTILEKGGQTQNQIGEKFSMPAHAVSRALDRLEVLGYVERKSHKTSRRALSIFATQEGEELAPRLFAIVKDVNRDLLKSLSDDENEVFGTLLKKILQDFSTQ